MAKIYEQFRYCLVKALVDIYAQVSIGAAGAPTLVSGKGITSIVRNSAGNYTVTFEDRYFGFIHAKFLQVAAAAEDLSFQVLAVSLSAKTVQFLCKDELVATDPSNGSSLYLQFSFKNSSL